MGDRSLHSYMYHYVRNPLETSHKGIKSVTREEFRTQVEFLSTQYEMASVSSLVDYFAGNYFPKRDLCILTFDDGLKEHGGFVTEELSKRQIQGIFFIATMPLEESNVLPVHKNHFLLSDLGIQAYRDRFFAVLNERFPAADIDVDVVKVKKTYRWDDFDVASFKYLLNYKLHETVRDTVLDVVFNEAFGDQAAFSKELYLSYEELNRMIGEGMAIGGHSHKHRVLSRLNDVEQKEDISTCLQALRTHCVPQSHWTFSYPFGKKNTYSQYAIETLKQLGIELAFTTNISSSNASQSSFEIGRFDPKDIPA